MDYIARTCLGWLIFVEIITSMKHLNFNYYVYLMRMSLNLAGKQMTSCLVTIIIIIVAYASFLCLSTGAYSYPFRDLLNASITTLRTAIAFVKLHIYFESSYGATVLNKAMLTSFYFVVSLVMINIFISIINDAMETVKGDKIPRAKKRSIYDASLNSYFWKRIQKIFPLHRKEIDAEIFTSHKNRRKS